MNPEPKSHVKGILVVLITLIFAVIILLNRQYFIDQAIVWQFKPTSDISRLASTATFTDKSTFYYYSGMPELEDRDTFNANCNNHPENTTTAILGCYTGQRIYIYNVTDARLDGITTVTAAHEMLHAIYERMGSSERDKINKLLQAEYAKLKGDKIFAARMAFYDKTEPGERDNELHSVIGTEIGSLSSELETYYKQYFTDRSQVVKLHDKYEAVFTDLQSQADVITAQLNSLSTSIDMNTKLYNSDSEKLDAEITAFNAKANNGGFNTQSEFNTARSILSARSDELRAIRQKINSDIDQYESLRTQLKSIAGQSDALNRSINSNLAPAPNL
jgi:prefoldin subunit 5